MVILALLATFSFIFSFGFLYLVRSYLVGDRLPSGDFFFHLLIIDSIREHGWAYPSSLDNVIFHYDVKPHNYLAYPPLFHYILALFPTRFRLGIVKIFNIMVLSALSSLSVILAYCLTSDAITAFLAGFFAIFNLANLIHTYKFSPRSLGLLLYSLIIAALALLPQSLIQVLILALFIALINLTHKFTTQVVTIGLFFYALLFNRYATLLSILLGFLLSIVIGRNFYLEILKEHYYWLYFFKKYPRRRSQISKILSILNRNTWYLSLMMLIVLSSFYKVQNLMINEDAIQMIFWALFPLFTSFFVALPALSFLGQEYRYVAYGIVPVGVANSLYMILPNNYNIWLVLLVCTLVTIFMVFKLKNHLHSEAFVEKSDIQSYRRLKNENIDNLLVFPITRALEVNYFTGLRVVGLVRPKSPWTKEYIEDLLDRYEIKNILRFKREHTLSIERALCKALHTRRKFVFKNFEIYECENQKW